MPTLSGKICLVYCVFSSVACVTMCKDEQLTDLDPVTALVIKFIQMSGEDSDEEEQQSYEEEKEDDWQQDDWQQDDWQQDDSDSQSEDEVENF